MIVVLDASAAVKLVLDEQDSEVARRIWDEEVTLLAPTVVLPEVGAAIARARREARISRAQETVAHRSWIELSEEIDLVTVDAELASEARQLTTERTLRGMDAVYVAVAARFGVGGSVGLLSFDRSQREAAGGTIGLLPAEVAATD